MQAQPFQTQRARRFVRAYGVTFAIVLALFAVGQLYEAWPQGSW